MRFALIDPAAGIAGDMLLGALLDVGAPPEWLRELPTRLGIPQVEIDISRVDRNGIGGTKVTVRLPGGTASFPVRRIRQIRQPGPTPTTGTLTASTGRCRS